MKEWNAKVSPERYLNTWPNGPQAALAKQHIAAGRTGGNAPTPNGKVRFFSPRSVGMTVIVVPTEWMTQQTPAGSRTIQSQGKQANFENNIFVTDDPEIIQYLTHEYKDRRFPIVRDDMRTASAVT